MINNQIKERVVEQKVGNVTMEEYMAEMLKSIEYEKIELAKSEMIIKGYKQLNVRHKNIIDAQRQMLKQLEFEKE